MARQRSRMLCLQAGDDNTAYFHLHASHRRRKNHFFKLPRGEAEATKQEEMNELSTSYFQELIGTPQTRTSTLNFDSLAFPAVDPTGLEQEFSETEIWDAIKAMSSDKSPGPDGFSMRFFQTCLVVVKFEVVNAIRQLTIADSRNFQALNSAYITLLPKKERTVDFLPISLLHSIAKIFSKALSLRLGPKLDELIAANQSAFFKGCTQSKTISCWQVSR
jgi:hypothetical protein